MFGRAIGAALSLIFLMASGAYFLHVPCRSQDLENYKKLLHESAAIHSNQSAKSTPVAIERKEVDREFWTDRPLHFRLKNQRSLLSIQQRGKRREIEEVCEGCEGWLYQDSPCHWSANESFYANEKWELKGNVQAQYQENEVKAEKAVLTQEKIHLEEEVSLKNPTSIFFADNADCYLRDSQPVMIESSGQVRFITTAILDDESFGLADRFLYIFSEKTLYLFSDPPKRVLFWQEGSALSAPQIQIQKGKIQGIGDVRCSFDLQEKNAIAELFSKYL